MKNAKFTEAHLEAYRQHLIADYENWTDGSVHHFDVVFEAGSKYTKVITENTSSRSSHSFIDAEGKIWKAASWKAPAKNFTRGDVTTGDFVRASWAGVN